MQQTKAARKNTAKQLQKAKKAGLIAANRLHSSGGEAKAPRVVTVLSLCPDCDPASIVEQLLASADVPMPAKNGSIYQAEFVFFTHFRCDMLRLLAIVSRTLARLASSS